MRSLALVLTLFLAGCGSVPFAQVEPETVGQRFYASVNGYAIAKAEAAAYLTSGPLCSDQDVLGCVSDDLAIKIDDITDDFDPRIDIALQLFEQHGAADQQAALELAREALRALDQALGETR